MTIQTRITNESWLTIPEPDNDNYDRLTVSHEPTLAKLTDLINRGEIPRYRKPGDVVMEVDDDGKHVFIMTWGSRDVAQEWIDFCATTSSFISGEIIET